MFPNAAIKKKTNHPWNAVIQWLLSDSPFADLMMVMYDSELNPTIWLLNIKDKLTSSDYFWRIFSYLNLCSNYVTLHVLFTFIQGGGVGEVNLLFSNYVSWQTGRDSVSSQSYMGGLRVARAKGDVTGDDSHGRFLVQHSAAMNRAAANWNNVATMLQRCFALKIVVANRPV